ncbi:amino acid adenylation domain-containing protein [Kribbella sp. NPDC051718]|uniref:amino acid adenylation domain-containing protein n=1 Tax=Kribbella sp. NPDC051718 TaxID=3155168 RepID=UPI00341B58E3
MPLAAPAAGDSAQPTIPMHCASSVPSYPEDEMVPLSYGQRRLWFIDRTVGPSPTYNVPLAFRISGSLDKDALEAAVLDMVERHESLRTVYLPDGDEIRQSVTELPGTTLVFESRKITESELDDVTAAEVARPFDLTTDVLIRTTLFEFGPDQYLLLFVTHHIATDAWSWDLLLRELTQAYAARRSAQAPEFPSLALRYADYAIWQREVYDGPEDDGDGAKAGELQYWRQKLAGLPEQLELPYDRARTEVSQHRGGTVDVRVGTETHARLAAIATSANTSMFMVGQAAVAAWLSYLGAGLDIPLGVAYAGRDDVALEELVGLFINSLTLRSDLSGDPAFEDLVHRVRDTTLEAFDHGAVPFDLVVEAVNPARSLDRNPVYQIMYGWAERRSADGGLDLDGVTVAAVPVSSGTSKFDLNISFTEQLVDGSPAGIVGEIEYDSALFSEETVRSMAKMLETLLDDVAKDPGLRLSEIDLIEPAQRELVTHSWNQTEQKLRWQNLPDMFTEQVRRDPDAVAMESPEETLTYAQLNHRTNRLAHLLIQRGAGPETFVAVVAPRRIALIAMLALFKAGATFLPIDPDYPRERISYTIDDAQPHLILTTEALAAEFSGHDLLVVDRADTVAALQRCPETNPEADDLLAPLSLESPAYIIYTSGSTGRPKGCVITARVLINLIAWQMDLTNAQPRTRVSQFGAVSFDAFEQEILAALFAGQTVVVPSEDDRRDLTRFAIWLDDQKINEFYAPDAVLRAVCEAAVEQELPLEQLRTVMQGGEAFQLTEAVRDFFRRRRDIEVYNHYGPSETHVITGMKLPADPATWPSVAPIGKMLWNCQGYVLDSKLRPVPVGVAGELYLGGDGLGRSYIRRPGLTAERFVANPFGAPGERMYRSGDVVRWNRKGEIEFIGRADDQVKIRGVRVELNEINSVLRQHHQVAEAATAVREYGPGDKRLISYIVPASSQHPDATELRRHVSSLLPAAVVPAAFVTLDALPKNTNGKLDRLALPEPDFGAQTGPDSREPRNRLETALCEAFAKVLGVGPVGVDDSFFDLGGHSLLAVRLVNEIRSSVGAEVPIRTLFENPTVDRLAAVIPLTEAETGPALTPRQRPELMPLSFVQRRLWFIDQLEGPSPQYNVPLLTKRLAGRLELGSLEAALTDVVRRHESLRTRLPDVDGKPFQLIIPAGDVSVSLHLQQVKPEELDESVVKACEYEFELADELLVRAEVFSLSDDDHVFVVVAHHSVCDGWSAAPLGRDLTRAYAARLAGETPEFDPLPVQYADYTLWQREMLGAEDDPDSIISIQLDIWRRALAGLPEEVILKPDRPRSAMTTARGAMVQFAVDAELYVRIQSLARAEGATPFMVLQAALAAALTQSGAGSDIALGTMVAGRADVVLDDLIGCFVNTLVLRTDTSGEPTFRELLARIMEADLQAFENQALPFERLVAAVKPPRSQTRHPLAQVMLALQTTADGIQLPGVEVHDFAVPSASTSQFDLAFSFVEGAEGQGAAGTAYYSTDLFDSQTIDGFVKRFADLLDSAVSDPDAKVFGSADTALPSGLEDDLCSMFAEVLGIESVAADDDFFDLGGHSLLAAELVGNIRRTYRIQLKLRDFFFSPTVAQVAELISARSGRTES